ncbi:MAG: CocE/NonD family hydrolase [Streptosporangiaceae bacterium]
MAWHPEPGPAVRWQLSIPLADGTLLAGDLYRPAGQSPGPVLVSYYPYRKDDIIGSLFERTRAGLGQRGYATLLVDMAGTGASEGSYGETFDLPREGRDCAEIVEWAAGQDWCDGTVGAWGVSYGGMTALAAAARRPPHLRGIVAVYATTDVYADTIAPGGCPAMLGRYAWAAHMAALDLCPPTRQDAAGRWRRIWEQRLKRLEAGQPHALTWQAHQERDDYWRDRVVDPTAIDVPALLIGGWADAYSDAMIRISSQVNGPKRLIMGPWMHVLPHLSAVAPFDWVAAMADWWDSCLRPDATRPEPGPPVLFFTRGSGWRAARQWPPAGVSAVPFYLAGHRLETEPAAGAGRRHYRTDPLAGLAAGIWDPFGTGNGWPEEQSGDDARSLTFTSDPLTEPLLLAGRPEADLCLAPPPGEEAHLTVRVCLVDADGRSTLLSTGWHRLPAGTGEGGATRNVTVMLGAAAAELPAGSRLRLCVACADFPHIWPTPTSPALAILTGPPAPSVLRLPVSRAADRADTPATPATPPAEPDTGWVTDGQPVYRLTQDKAAGETAVTFGAKSRLHPPSGADLRVEETFTARLRPGRPDGATVSARVDVSLLMPAGERVQVAVRSTSHRRSAVIEARVTLDGTTVLTQRWPDVPARPPGPAGS